jgi:hypothetical protein
MRQGIDGTVLGEVERHLVCKLTADEIALYGRQVGGLAGQLRDETASFDAAKEGHKGRVKDLETKMAKRHAALESGSEMRPVQCMEVYNETTDRVDVIRRDTLAIVDHRPLSQFERQGDLFKRPTPTPPQQTADGPATAQ